MKYHHWLSLVGDLSHKKKIYIDPYDGYFKPLFAKGMSPEEAVELMIKGIGNAERLQGFEDIDPMICEWL